MNFQSVRDMFAHGSAPSADGQAGAPANPLKNSFHLLRDHGYTEGVISKLATDANVSCHLVS